MKYPAWYTEDNIPWYSIDGWATFSKKEQIQHLPFREKVERLERHGYQVMSFDPGVTFVDPNIPDFRQEMTIFDRQVRLDARAWDFMDNLLKEIDKLKGLPK